MKHLWTKYDIIQHMLKSDQVISFYMGEPISLHRKMASPFRKDPKPSLAFYETDEGDISWTDFGKPFSFKRDGIGFVMALFDMQFKEAVNKIYDDIILKKIVPPKASNTTASSLPLIKIREHFTSSESNYWKDYGISVSTLLHEQIYALDSLSYDMRIAFTSTLESPKFYYHFDEDSFKIYMPLDYNNRFRSFNIRGVVERYNTLPKNGDNLIITSSTKDSLVVKKLGYNAVNPTGETTLGPILAKYAEFEERFKNVYIMLDNDKTGCNSTDYLTAYSNWRWKKIPFHGAKDQSDLVKSTSIHNLAYQIKKVV